MGGLAGVDVGGWVGVSASVKHIGHENVLKCKLSLYFTEGKGRVGTSPSYPMFTRRDTTLAFLPAVVGVVVIVTGVVVEVVGVVVDDKPAGTH